MKSKMLIIVTSIFAIAMIVAIVFAMATSAESEDIESSTPQVDVSDSIWTVEDYEESFLSFQSDGLVAGSDGCNNISGKYDQEELTVTFSKFMSTKMACEGAPSSWVGFSSRGELSKDLNSMRVFDEAGDELGTLIRN